MNDSFENQVCLITGGADGLGFALAEHLIGKDAIVCLLDIDPVKLKQASLKFGQHCRTYLVDIRQEETLFEVVTAIMQEFHRIDVLVNSAGITGKTNLKTHEVETCDFDLVISLNVRGSFLACRAVLPHMLIAGYGRILNIASIAGKDGNAGMVAYSTSKAAVIGMTKSLGKEYAETGVTINALAPAVIQTALVAAMPEAQVKYMTDRIPMKRCGTLDEFVAMAEFIISSANSFTTGFTFDLSGGRAVY